MSITRIPGIKVYQESKGTSPAVLIQRIPPREEPLEEEVGVAVQALMQEDELEPEIDDPPPQLQLEGCVVDMPPGIEVEVRTESPPLAAFSVVIETEKPAALKPKPRVKAPTLEMIEIHKFLPCDLCDAKFESVLGLSIHRKKIHPESPGFGCAVCQAHFSHGTQLLEHYKMDHMSFSCQKCNRIFFRQEEFEDHVDHGHKNDLAVTHPPMRKISKVIQEAAIFTPPPPNRPSIHDLEGLELAHFDRVSQLLTMDERRKESGQFCCSACKKGFRSKAQLKDQGLEPELFAGGSGRDPGRVYPYRCPCCKLLFRHFLSWRTHLSTLHHQGYSHFFVCPICQEIQYDRGMQEWHVANLHRDVQTQALKAFRRPATSKSLDEDIPGLEMEDLDDEEMPSKPKRKRIINKRLWPVEQRKNAATTKLPGQEGEAPPLDELTPAFVARVRTESQRRHFRQGHAEKFLIDMLLRLAGRVHVEGEDNPQTPANLIDIFHHFWDVFYHERYLDVQTKLTEEVRECIRPLDLAGYEEQSSGPLTPQHRDGFMLFGRYIVRPKLKRRRLNTATSRFPGPEKRSAPPLEQLSYSDLAQLNYDQERRFRRAHSETLLYRLLRLLPRLPDEVQETLLKSAWRYWWVFYPREFMVLA